MNTSGLEAASPSIAADNVLLRLLRNHRRHLITLHGVGPVTLLILLRLVWKITFMVSFLLLSHHEGEQIPGRHHLYHANVPLSVPYDPLEVSRRDSV